jgi:hypothetical protein
LNTLLQVPVALAVLPVTLHARRSRRSWCSYCLRLRSRPRHWTSTAVGEARPTRRCGTTQPPVLLHETALVFVTCANAVQSWPQEPQFVGSVVLLTHFEPQRSGLGATQLEAQAGEAPAVEHKPVGDMHTFVHDPQCAGCVRFVSQPSSGVDVQ